MTFHDPSLDAAPPPCRCGHHAADHEHGSVGICAVCPCPEYRAVSVGAVRAELDAARAAARPGDPASVQRVVDAERAYSKAAWEARNRP